MSHLGSRKAAKAIEEENQDSEKNKMLEVRDIAVSSPAANILNGSLSERYDILMYLFKKSLQNGRIVEKLTEDQPLSRRISQGSNNRSSSNHSSTIELVGPDPK